MEKAMNFPVSRITKGLLAVLLCFTLVLSGCSTSWISEAEQTVAVLLPAAVNIITLVSVLEGKGVSAYDLNLISTRGAEVDADLEIISSLLTQYQKADATAQPGILSKISITAGVIQANLSYIQAGLHISDPATQAKVAAVVAIVVSEVKSFIAILPIVNPASSPELVRVAILQATKTPPLNARQFVIAYNATLTAKTGSADLDKATSGLKIHQHGKLARYAAAGLLK